MKNRTTKELNQDPHRARQVFYGDRVFDCVVIISLLMILFAFISKAVATEVSQIDLISTCLIREAGGKGECMTSIMHVIKNRSKEHSEDGFFRVIIKPHQFESIHGKNHFAIVEKAKQHPRWEEAQNIVNQALNDSLPETKASSATHFFNPKIVIPKWASKMKFVARIGNHDFYFGK